MTDRTTKAQIDFINELVDDISFAREHKLDLDRLRAFRWFMQAVPAATAADLAEEFR